MCAVEYGMIDEDDLDMAEAMIVDAAGEDGKVDKKEAKKAAKKAKKAMDATADELAQEKPKKEGPNPDGSGSDSGPDSEDLEALADDLSLDSEDVEELLDGELAQKSGPGSGPESGEGSYELPSDMELAQKKKGEGSGSGSGPDSEDLEGLADDLSLDSEDVEALLDGELAQKSGPGSGSGSGPDSEDLEALLDGELAQKSGPGSGPDSEDLEALADEIGSDLDLAQEEKKPKGPKCPSKSEMEAVPEEKVFDMIDQDGSTQIDEEEGLFAISCLVKAEILSEEDGAALFEYLGEAAGEDELLSKEEAEAAMAALDA